VQFQVRVAAKARLSPAELLGSVSAKINHVAANVPAPTKPMIPHVVESFALFRSP
jgi:hypothetical protein